MRNLRSSWTKRISNKFRSISERIFPSIRDRSSSGSNGYLCTRLKSPLQENSLTDNWTRIQLIECSFLPLLFRLDSINIQHPHVEAFLFLFVECFMDFVRTNSFLKRQNKCNSMGHFYEISRRFSKFLAK